MNNLHLSINQLTGYRGERLLFDQLQFDLQSGEILQIVGANGSGKTTLLRTLVGLSPLQSGEIHWQNQPIQKSENYASSFYYLGHLLGIKSELTVVENLKLDWRIQASNDDEIQTVLTQLDLWPYKNKACRSLSRGQKQRLALAKMMLSQTPLWILDEPFASLDQSAILLLQNIFMEKLQKGGLIIFTSHQPLTVTDLKPKTVVL